MSQEKEEQASPVDVAKIEDPRLTNGEQMVSSREEVRPGNWIRVGDDLIAKYKEWWRQWVESCEGHEE